MGGPSVKCSAWIGQYAVGIVCWYNETKVFAREFIGTTGGYTMRSKEMGREMSTGMLHVRSRTWWLLAVVGSLMAWPATSWAQSCNTDIECDDGIPCTDDFCFGSISRTCIHTSNCDDGAFCTGNEACCSLPGGCGGTAFGDCIAGSAPCAAGDFCDEGANTCVGCILDSHCDDGNGCTADFCSAGVCSNNPITGACSDGDPCTTGDTCNLGVCEGTPLDCQALAGDCEFGNCNTGTGACEFFPKPNGSLCNDGDHCSAIDTCLSGVCEGGFADGCVRLEVRTPLTPITVGEVVRVEVWMVNDGCASPPFGLCPQNLGQPVAGLEAAISWDPAVLRLVPPPVNCSGITSPDADGDGVPDPCENPEDPCISLDPCVEDCGSPVAYNWAASGTSFPQDCNGDSINFPCPGFPDNDGDLFLLGFKELLCGGVQAPPACVGANGLLVTRLKFEALAATAGVSNGTPIAVEQCIGQTRTKIAGGVTPGEDVLGSLGAPQAVFVDCTIDADCPVGICLGGTCGTAPPPTLEAVGPRYIEVTPQDMAGDIAILVTGVDPEVACLSQYVRDDGRLADAPYFQPPGPAGWGTVNVRGEKLVSGFTYNVQIDVDPQNPGISLSQPVAVTLWGFGDVDNVGGVDIIDITRIIDGFQAAWNSVTPCTTDADCSTVRPNFECDTSAGFCVWITVENVDIKGSSTCLPERVIDIIDITVDIDAFSGQPDVCAEVACP